MKQRLGMAAAAAFLLGTVATASLAQQPQPAQPTQPPASTQPSTPPMTGEPKQPTSPSAPGATSPDRSMKGEMQGHACSTTRAVGQTCTCADQPGKAGRVERSSDGGQAQCVLPRA